MPCSEEKKTIKVVEKIFEDLDGNCCVFTEL